MGEQNSHIPQQNHNTATTTQPFQIVLSSLSIAQIFCSRNISKLNDNHKYYYR